MTTKSEMSKRLMRMSATLSQHMDKFPGLATVVAELVSVAQDPMGNNVRAKVKERVPIPKPVTINYSGETLLVRGVPWGQLGVALKLTFNKIVGKQSKALNPETGQPYFLSCYDKKAKGFRLPREKADEVLAALQDANLPVVAK